MYLIVFENDFGIGENCFICLRKNLKLRISIFEYNEDGEEVVGSLIDWLLFWRLEIKWNVNRKYVLKFYLLDVFIGKVMFLCIIYVKLYMMSLNIDKKILNILIMLNNYFNVCILLI